MDQLRSEYDEGHLVLPPNMINPSCLFFENVLAPFLFHIHPLTNGSCTTYDTLIQTRRTQQSRAAKMNFEASVHALPSSNTTKTMTLLLSPLSQNFHFVATRIYSPCLIPDSFAWLTSLILAYLHRLGFHVQRMQPTRTFVTVSRSS